MGAQNFNFAPKFPTNRGLSAPNVYFWTNTHRPALKAGHAQQGRVCYLKKSLEQALPHCPILNGCNLGEING